MNGFMFPRTHRAGSVSARSFLALALAGWFGLNTVSAQEAEAPAAPPALLSEDTPTELLVIEEAPPAKPVTARPAGRALMRTFTKGPNSKRNPRPLPTTRRPEAPASVWAEPEEAELEAPAARPIRQVQALVPNEGLAVDPIEGTEPLAPLSEAAPFEPGQSSTLEEAPLLEEPGQQQSSLEVAPDELVPLDEPAPLMEEPDAEPAPFQNRVSQPQRVPAQSQVRRTAAAELAPYNERGANPPATEFGPQDVVHAVAAGESFWSISKKHYGLGRYSAALAEYNKSRIPKPDKIKPGMKVIVPPLETLEQRYERMIFGASASISKEEAAAPVKSGFFIDAEGQPMYRVGDGDTLSTIAQDHLGRSSRWPRIVELNRESLSDPDDMKLGMILRLPADASEAIQAK